MACPWTNKHRIKRDLYVAQGRKVPADIDGTATDDKPPRAKFTEENNDYLQKYTVFDDFQTPNFHLIQEMLNVVRGTDTDLEDVTSMLQSPLDLVNSEFLPKCVSTPLPEEDFKIGIMKKEKRQRNVAVASLLEAIDGHDDFVNDYYTKQDFVLSTKPVKLLKPSDFSIQEGPELIQNSKDLENVNKSKGLLEKRVKRIVLEPKFMFKKKVSSRKSIDNVKSKQPEPNCSNISAYVPSSLADKYYQKFKARSFVKQLLQEHLWVRVEKQITDIDEERELAEQLSKLLDIAKNKMIQTDLANVSNELTLNESFIEKADLEMSMNNFKRKKSRQVTESEKLAVTEEMSNSVIHSEDLSVLQDKAKYGMKIVELPQYRHLLTGDCIVCKVVGKMDWASTINSM